MCTHTADAAQIDAFGDRMQTMLNHAALALMCSIGHQLKLFDTLAGQPPQTSQQLADTTGLQERYLREWLAVMVTGGIVSYHSVAGTYELPTAHAAWLTHSASMHNMAYETQAIALLAQVETPLLECFRHGGGVPYAAYPRFQQLMAEGSQRVFDTSLLDAILPLVPGLLSRLQHGIQVLEVGCGSGYALNLMAQAFPGSSFTGYDFSPEGIGYANAQAQRLQLANVSFRVCDLTTMDDQSQFDLITAFDAIHDQGQPAQVLRAIAHALRPDGVFLMGDVRASSNLAENISMPLAPFMYTISCMHCMPVSLAQGGVGLGAMWGKELACQMLGEAGFTNIQVAAVEADSGNLYYIAQR
jgi:SAM-dependent methyltransferase